MHLNDIKSPFNLQFNNFNNNAYIMAIKIYVIILLYRLL